MGPESGTLSTPNADEDMDNRNSLTLLVGMQNSSATLEDSLAMSYKLLLPCDPAITLLGIYSKELKTYVCRKTYIECLLLLFNDSVVPDSL